MKRYIIGWVLLLFAVSPLDAFMEQAIHYLRTEAWNGGYLVFIVIGAPLLFVSVFFTARAFVGGQHLPLRWLSRWQVITIRAICIDSGVMEVRILAETKPGEIIYIKSWFSSAGGLDPHTLKVGYHYRYAGGNMLEPLPMGKNT